MATKEPAEAPGESGASPGAGEAGDLDLSLGHIGTSEGKTRFLAWCLACNLTMSEEAYQALESLEGLDPRCPGCDRAAWEFDEDPRN